MKGLASARRLRVADFYTQTVEAFIRDKLASHSGILAVPNDAVHITIDVPSEFARTVRTAVFQLYEPSERAA